MPLAPYTSFGIGGPARFFAEAATEDDLVRASEWARERGLPLFVLGGGSNVLVADEGFPGLVLRVGLRGVERRGGTFTVAAGEDWDALVTRTVQAGCAGMECLAGIPGLTGGTPVQNVGAYGQEVAQTIAEVRCFDRETSRFVTLEKQACRFAYRASRFNTGADAGRYIVASVTFALQEGGPPTLAYPDLQRHFAGARPSLAEVAEGVRAIRRGKGMSFDAAVPLEARDPDTRSAGSYFKNPVVADSVYEVLARTHPGAPSYPAGPGLRKLPAAWLLEQAGFPRGFALGRAALSSKHTLALTNRTGQARAADILGLQRVLQQGVRDRFGIELHPEPIFVS